ncbi:glycosyltransferase, partial [Flavobacteriales bacterium]|nr:glycosyltransferase [Flavobacteriales bacterium]
IYFEESNYGYLPLRNKIFTQLDNVISISEDGIKYLSVKLNFDTLNIKLSRLGVINVGKILQKEREELLIVSCSNLIAVKRVHLITKALAITRDCKIRWVHFGDGKKKKEIIDYCSRNFSKDINVEFKGRVLNKEVLDFYINNAPDLFINLSSSEGIPLSIMEAMSCSIPVIATNVGGTSEIVNNENGMLIEKDFNIKEVSEFIKKVYTLNNKEKEVYRNNAYDTWSRLYDADKNYSAFIREIKFDDSVSELNLN